ncbi:MAG: ABC transporter ATP-binding protein [SAR324 cluster bacterium]
MSALLEVDGLSKHFGALQAVESLRFSVNPGEILGIIGPNGAGKTTAIDLISGMTRPDSGTVTFAGEDVTGMRTDILVRRGLVRTFQATTVYQERTVRENAVRGAFAGMYPGFWHGFWNDGTARRLQRAAGERVDGVLGRLGLTEVADSVARNLPYGHQKVLGLAIALAAQPRLMMLDEPVAGLAHEEAVRLAEVIRLTNAGGVSVIVVDHNMRFMSNLCQRIVVLHHGSDLAVGTPQEVTRDPRVIEAYLGTLHELA